MGWLFEDSTAEFVTLGAGTESQLDLPDADWAIAGWVKLVSNVGAEGQYVLSRGLWRANPSVNVFMHEASHATVSSRNKWSVELGDNDTTDVSVKADTATGGSTDWQHLITERSGTTVTLYVNGSSYGATTSASFDADGGSNAIVFGKNSGDAEPLNGYLAEWACWSRVLTAAEKASLCSTGRPSDLDATSRAWYLPMYDDFNEEWASLTVTNNGGNVSAVTAVHPVTYEATGLAVPVAASYYNQRRRGE